MTSPNNGNTAPDPTDLPIQDQPWARVVAVQFAEHSELAGIHPDMPLHSIHSWPERITNRMRGEHGTVYRKPLSGRQFRRLQEQEAALPATPDGYAKLQNLESEIPPKVDLKTINEVGPDGSPRLGPDKKPRSIETDDERLWRTAVVYTLGKSSLDPDALRKFLTNKYKADFANADHDDAIEKLITAMHERKIIKGVGGYRGFQVIARHDTSPEALRTVAVYFAEQRTEGPREELKAKATAIKRDYVAKELAARDVAQGATRGRNYKRSQEQHLKAVTERNDASGQVVNAIRGQLDDYWGSLVKAEKDLGISIPNLQILTKQLARMGFLKIPVLDMGESFDSKENAKLREKQPRYKASTHEVILEGNIDDLPSKLTDVFEATKLPGGHRLYDSNRIKTRAEVEKDKADKAKADAEAAEQARQAAEQARMAVIQAHEAAEEQRRKDEAAEEQRKHDEMVAAIKAQTAATQAQADALKAQATAAQNAANATRIAAAAEAAARQRREAADRAARDQEQQEQRQRDAAREQQQEQRDKDLRDFMAATLGAVAAQNAANPASEHGGTGAGKGQVIEVDEHGQVKFVNEQ